VNFFVAVQLLVAPAFTATEAVAKSSTVAWSLVKKIVMLYVASVGPALFAVPLAVQPPSEAAHFATVIALRLSMSFTIEVAAGNVFWVSGTAEPEAGALLAAANDLLAEGLDLLQAVADSNRPVASRVDTVRVIRRGGCIVRSFARGHWYSDLSRYVV
jgi:hypothetical protein